MYITYKNIKLYYDKIGNKKDVIVILPGWGNTKDTFKTMIDSLKDNYTLPNLPDKFYYLNYQILKFQ